MHLDLVTMSAVSIVVTAILGVVLVLTWARERENPFVGWWGLAQLFQSIGILIAAITSAANAADLVSFGPATMLLAESLKWKAAREFENRRFPWPLLFVGPLMFLGIVHSGLIQSFDARLFLMSTIIGLYNLAVACELERGRDERLVSRKPAIVLLVFTAIGQLSWLPLILSQPIGEVGRVYSSDWFPFVLIVTLSLRVALAFLVLAMSKERQESKQRVGALTDPLTGLPNRRALFEATDALVGRGLTPELVPVSVLLFDLDRFKETNDGYGHLVGDRVLGIFASTLRGHFGKGATVARLGGEEFAAILPGADAKTAVEVGEAVRVSFASSAALVDGMAVGGTVSVGVACNLGSDCDFGALFRQADVALYAAKRAGRNRVELVGPTRLRSPKRCAPRSEQGCSVPRARRRSSMTLPKSESFSSSFGHSTGRG
jgi:diguanylate cyclase (GGDEF)-like protein